MTYTGRFHLALSLGLAASLTASCAAPTAGGDRASGEAAPAAPSGRLAGDVDVKGGGAGAPAAEAAPPGGPLVAQGAPPEPRPPAPGPREPGRAPPPPAGRGKDPLDDIGRQLGIDEQEKKFLADSHFKAGQSLYGELRYREAIAELKRCLKVDPSHVEARRLLEQALYIVGDSDGYKDVTRQYIDETEVKIQLGRMEVERLYNDGLRLMQQKEFTRAAEKFERVLEALRWFPWDIDTSGLRGQAEAELKKARSEESAREQLFREQQQQAAKEAARLDELRSQAYHQARIKTLFEQATEAYARNEFDKCKDLCYRVLSLEPTHANARKLVERAETARRLKAELDILDEDTEQMQRVIEGVREAAVPFQSIFAFPSDEQWAAVEKRAVDIQEYFERKGEPESPDEARIRATLATRKVTMDFRGGVSFEDALTFLRDVTGLNYVVAADAQAAVADVKLNLKVRDITLKNALELILGQAPDLIYKIKHDAVVINTKGSETEDLVLRFYEVSEIVNDLPDNPAPNLALKPGGESQGGGGGATGAILNIGEEEGAEIGTGIGPDKLKELIEGKALAGDVEGGTVEFLGGLLMVRMPLSVHKKIEKLLEALKRTTGITVTVETRFVDVQDNFLEEIGVDFRGLPALIAGAFAPGQPTNIGYNYTGPQRNPDYDIRARIINLFSQQTGSTAATPFRIAATGGGAFQYNFLEDFQLQAILEAVKKQQKARLVDAPRITVFNGQRSHLMTIRQEAYISDIEVNQTGVTPTINPVIGILNSGSILEARPIVSHDRRFVTLEIKPTLAVDLTSAADATTLTLAAGNTNISIELPVVSLSEIKTTVMVPDGGTVIIGGLKNFRQVENWAGVPIISKVPILRNLFERKGYADLKRSLIVLLTCHITIGREEEARRFNRSGTPF